MSSECVPSITDFETAVHSMIEEVAGTQPKRSPLCIPTFHELWGSDSIEDPMERLLDDGEYTELWGSRDEDMEKYMANVPLTQIGGGKKRKIQGKEKTLPLSTEPRSSISGARSIVDSPKYVPQDHVAVDNSMITEPTWRQNINVTDPEDFNGRPTDSTSITRNEDSSVNPLTDEKQPSALGYPVLDRCSQLITSLMETVPSNITDVPWVYKMPPTRTESSNVGKWMLFLNKMRRDDSVLTDLDRTWPLIESLVDQGNLGGAKCSTGYCNPFSSNDQNGVIICYTDDYTDKKQVKSSADAIRNVVYYQSPLYYKTDIATSSGIYQIHGNKAVSMYRHTNDGKLYERDSSSKWVLVDV